MLWRVQGLRETQGPFLLPGHSCESIVWVPLPCLGMGNSNVAFPITSANLLRATFPWREMPSKQKGFHSAGGEQN